MCFYNIVATFCLRKKCYYEAEQVALTCKLALKQGVFRLTFTNCFCIAITLFCKQVCASEIKFNQEFKKNEWLEFLLIP